jgi:hypothetical protein
MLYTHFIEGLRNNGGVLIDGYYSGTRSYLEAIQPKIIEIPTKNNGIVYKIFGVQLRNSDFGASRLELRGFEINVICMNGLTGKSYMSEVHLGRKIPEEINISTETMIHDTKAQAGLIKDTMITLFSSEYLEKEIKKTQTASEYEINPEQAIKKLPKVNVTDEEKLSLTKLFMERKEEDGMQGKPTLYMLSQGISAIARDSKNQDRKRELSEYAYNLIETVCCK